MNQNQSAPAPKSSPIIRPWVLILLVVVVIAAAIYWWITKNKTTSNVTPTASPTVSTSPKVSPSAASLTYTNSTYGFTLTFPSRWQGYKMKEKTFTGEVITYYVTVPTTDKSVVASDINDAGYYASFAISVYTLSQWNTVQAEEGPTPTLITKNATYAFAWSQANGVPPSDWTDQKISDVKTIIDSFKLQ